MFGRYRIVRLLGEGGMGAVYEAVHPILKKRVAIKTLLPSLSAQADARARFLREGEAASRINHPNVVAVHDVGTAGDISFLVMEFLEGETLDALLERRLMLGVPESVDIMLPVISAVAAGHDQGVIHRDLKPQNIFLARGSFGDAVPKVLDFGVSKLVGERADVALTGTQAVLGTVAYMSPEQARGAKNVDAQSDQYAVGLILYEMVTGGRAHPGDSALEILHHIASGTIVAPRAARPDLLPAMDEALRRCLAPQPRDRFPSLRALGQFLLPLAGEKIRMALADGFRDPMDAGAAAASLPASRRTMIMPPESEPRPANIDVAAPVSDTGRGRAGGTRILTPPPRHATDSTFRQVASELGPVPSPRKRSGSRATIVATLLVGAGAAAAFVLARGGLPTHAGDAQDTSATTPAVTSPAPTPAVAAAPALTRPAPSPATPVTPAPLRMRRIDVRVVPARGEITLDDGRPVRRRLEVKLPADGVTHTLTFSAAGYADQTVTFSADTPPPPVVSLARERVRSASGRPTRARRLGARGGVAAGASESESTTEASAPPGEEAPPAAPPPADESSGTPRRGTNNAFILK